MTMSIAEEKKAVRAAAVLRRDAAHARLKDTAPAALAANFLAHFALADDAVVSAYWPGRSEFDVRPLLLALHARGHALALPVVVARGTPLLFRRWRPGEALEAKPFGLQEPRAAAGELAPTVLLVPYLAIDRDGYRVGYGAGFYDRTLTTLRAQRRVLAVGVGYAAQEVERLPHDGYDERLDASVTEEGVKEFAAAQRAAVGSGR